MQQSTRTDDESSPIVGWKEYYCNPELDWNSLTPKQKSNENYKFRLLISSPPKYWVDQHPDLDWNTLEVESKMTHIIKSKKFWEEGNFGKKKPPKYWLGKKPENTEYLWRIKTTEEQLQIIREYDAIQNQNRKRSRSDLSTKNNHEEEDVDNNNNNNINQQPPCKHRRNVLINEVHNLMKKAEIINSYLEEYHAKDNDMEFISLGFVSTCAGVGIGSLGGSISKHQQIQQQHEKPTITLVGPSKDLCNTFYGLAEGATAADSDVSIKAKEHNNFIELFSKDNNNSHHHKKARDYINDINEQRKRIRVKWHKASNAADSIQQAVRTFLPETGTVIGNLTNSSNSDIVDLFRLPSSSS